MQVRTCGLFGIRLPRLPRCARNSAPRTFAGYDLLI
jgi:hypothetical protein